MRAGGDEFGACGSGLKDWRIVLYPVEAALSLRDESLSAGLVGDVSLMPRLWPAKCWLYDDDPTEDIVLVRLGAYGLDEDDE